MQASPIPLDEPARLCELSALNILDTAPEERFDRLTRLAKGLFNVPVSLISFIDDNRQWLKSYVGLDTHLREVDRKISFCGHAILKNEPFIIPDASKDERFKDNPLVTDTPGIRFYAGYPLSSNGQKIGTLCIVDFTPRTLDASEISLLKDLAAIAESELTALALATSDELTGIANRRGFKLLAEQSLKVFARQGLPAFLALVDLNKFKYINDNFGHAEGDKALLAFVEQMKKTFRESDIFARLGGDEFVVLLGAKDIEAAENSMKRLVGLLGQYNQTSNRGYDIEFSYGLVELNTGKYGTIEAALAKADGLMYQLKKP